MKFIGSFDNPRVLRHCAAVVTCNAILSRDEAFDRRQQPAVGAADTHEYEYDEALHRASIGLINKKTGEGKGGWHPSGSGLVANTCQ